MTSTPVCKDVIEFIRIKNVLTRLEESLLASFLSFFISSATNYRLSLDHCDSAFSGVMAHAPRAPKMAFITCGTSDDERHRHLCHS